MIPLRPDTVTMPLSAAFLLYGGWLATTSSSPRDTATAGAQKYPVSDLEEIQPTFPYETEAISVRQVIDGRVTRSFLILGTLCTLLTAIVATSAPPVPLSWGLAAGAYLLVFVIAIVAAHTTRLLWHYRRETRELMHRFFEWLEAETGDPGVKDYQFDLVVPNIAAGSRFPPLLEFMQRHGHDNDTVSRWVVEVARASHYAWRCPDFREWAGNLLRDDRSPRRPLWASLRRCRHTLGR